MSTHTPGPWFADEDPRPNMRWNRQIMSGPTTTVCFMAHSDGADTETDEANARLITAAPELLDALIAIRDRLKQCEGVPVTPFEAFDSFYREIVDEAIAKATEVS